MDDDFMARVPELKTEHRFSADPATRKREVKDEEDDDCAIVYTSPIVEPTRRRVKREDLGSVDDRAGNWRRAKGEVEEQQRRPPSARSQLQMEQALQQHLMLQEMKVELGISRRDRSASRDHTPPPFDHRGRRDEYVPALFFLPRRKPDHSAPPPSPPSRHRVQPSARAEVKREGSRSPYASRRDRYRDRDRRDRCSRSPAASPYSDHRAMRHRESSYRSQREDDVQVPPVFSIPSIGRRDRAALNSHSSVHQEIKREGSRSPSASRHGHNRNRDRRDRNDSRSASPRASRHANSHRVPRGRNRSRSPIGSRYGSEYDDRGRRKERDRRGQRDRRRSGSRSTNVAAQETNEPEKTVKSEEGEEVEDGVFITKEVTRERPTDSSYADSNPFTGGISANVNKRAGTRDDPVAFAPSPSLFLKEDGAFSISVLSEVEKLPFRVVMLDPTYGQYPLEPVRVTRDEDAIRSLKAYDYEFFPKMYGPHIVLLTTDEYFLVHQVRVSSRNPPPPRARGEGPMARPLTQLSVHGVPQHMRSLFHAPRQRRADEKFVDPGQVLERLLG